MTAGGAGPSTSLAAVVLAGGGSRRFGTDKLSQLVGPDTLLDLALAGLPAGAEVIIVGPAVADRPGTRYVREHPVGGGPAAAIVQGLRVALQSGVDAVLVLPGDAPQAGRSAAELWRHLDRDPELQALVAVDADGREQPLQLALRAAAAAELVAAAGPTAGAGASARSLVRVLSPAHHRMDRAALFDIDTADQLTAWLHRDSAPVEAVVAAIRERRDRIVVAVDGRSGAGKSTLALALQLRTDGVIVHGDDFYAAGSLDEAERGACPDHEVSAAVIDWRRLRTQALEPLARGTAARYQPYDWAVDDGRLARERWLAPQPVIILDGVYSGRPELADLVDLAVHVDIDPGVRGARLAAREGDEAAWVAFWERGERYYFERVRPPESFDLRVPGFS